MRYYCCDERRLQVVKRDGQLNGLEYIEVDDSGNPGGQWRQRTLFVKFIRKDPALGKDNFCIEGGERIKNVEIEWVHFPDALPAGSGLDPNVVARLVPVNEFLVVRTTGYGDFSMYTLRLVRGRDDRGPPANFDPRLCAIQFSFKVQCPTDFDCLTSVPCPAPATENPRLDYLARDYASFRRLMLDRMSTLLPNWRSRNVADLGVMLVELLAYVGDQLSYQQDAIGTEAYLATARRRVSLRRHARLVDYTVHEGCNARAWVRVSASVDAVVLPKGTQLLTRVPGLPDRLVPDSKDHLDALAAGATVFEVAERTLLYQDHAQFSFYTWGDQQCCLPKGATAATLRGDHPKLKAGDVLVFAELRGARTGCTQDADPDHRCAVRLTHVYRAEDPSGGLFESPPHPNPVTVTEIQWAKEDALLFPLCVSAITEALGYIDDISVAYGNTVLASHGQTITAESVGKVPEPRFGAPRPAGHLTCDRPEGRPFAPRFRPTLQERPVTYMPPVIREVLLELKATSELIDALEDLNSGPVNDAFKANGITLTGTPVLRGGDDIWSMSDGTNVYFLWLRAVWIESPGRRAGWIEIHSGGAAACRVTSDRPRDALPEISLVSRHEGQREDWEPKSDLLGSDANATEFVVEVESDGSAQLRFGDDTHGKRPNAGAEFEATYRVGNGLAGNVGRDSIAHIVSLDSRFLSATDPLPAQGGVEPETAEEIRRDAPQAFRKNERAVTLEDYAEVTQRNESVQRAVATMRWTGSWHTVSITVDPRGGTDLDEGYPGKIRDFVERYRMAGYDLEVEGPQYVSLELEMKICVKPDHFRGKVRAALEQVFGTGWLPDGRRAVFHPDNFTFGQPVYLSELYRAAQAVEGVASVEIDKFQRQRAPSREALDSGVMEIGRLEVARLENNRNYPEHGVLRLNIGGGK
jgi:hypothetical protein